MESPKPVDEEKIQSTNIYYLKQEGNVVSSKNAISDTMNQHFYFIGMALALEIEDPPVTLLSGEHHLNSRRSRYKLSPILV